MMKDLRPSRAAKWLGAALFAVLCCAIGGIATLYGAIQFGLVDVTVVSSSAVSEPAIEAVSEPAIEAVSEPAIEAVSEPVETAAVEELESQEFVQPEDQSILDEAMSEDLPSFAVPPSLDPVFATSTTSVLVDPYLSLNFLASSVDPDIPDAEDIPRIAFDRDAVLADFDNRIGEDFKIPDGLRNRVGFWFDVYTKYDSNARIIHHSDFPWLIFKTVDVSAIVNAESPRFLWMRREKADKIVKEEAQRIRAAIRSLLAKKTLPESPDEYQALVIEQLSKIDGDMRRNLKRALGEVRIQTGQRNFFITGLEISPRYLGTMEKIFRERRMPIELTRIPFVESSFNKHATSKVGASGIWQFMGNTGRKFMMVDTLIDERRSPFKATEGAAKLLKENHLILYRKWPLAVTAWNHGPGGLKRAAKVAGSKELADIVARYRSRSFDFASSNFYSEFLAALHAERYNDLVFGPINRVAAIDLRSFRVPKRIPVKEIVRVSGMSLEEFLTFNPELSKIARRGMPVPKGFRVHIPEHARLSVERLFALERKVALQRPSDS